MQRVAGGSVAVFPSAPEREIYNNAVLDRELDAAAARAAVDAVEATYAAAGVEQFAIWAHDSEPVPAAELGERGYTIAEWTRPMTLALADLREPDPQPLAEPASWAEYLGHLRELGLAPKLLTGIDPAAYRVSAVRAGGAVVSIGLAFERESDCGIFNLSTLPGARGRGYATAVTEVLLREARERGCLTASLQSTPLAEPLYARLGFAPLGRFLEFSP